METRNKIIQAYINHVLLNGRQPASVYAFSKELELEEREFYTYYSSFNALEASIWEQFFSDTQEIIESQEVWAGYTVREKFLSLFYSFTEHLKGSRSFVVYSTAQIGLELGTPVIMISLKKRFYSFADRLVAAGIESGELSERRFISSRYVDAIWIQFVFVINFWLRDTSANFEKTDEAIEKGLNVTFDLMSRVPLESILDYGKFIFRNAKVNL